MDTAAELSPADIRGDLPDADADAAVPKLAGLCPADVTAAVLTTLLPRPRRAFAWGDLVPLQTATMDVHDDTELLAPELDGLRGRLGLTPGSGVLDVVVHPLAHWNPFLDQCGLQGDGGQQAFFLSAQAASARDRAPDADLGGPAVSVHLLARDEAGMFHAFKTLEKLIIADAGQVQVRAAVVLDRPEHLVRGVVEGFYGDRWTHEARLAMLREMAALGFNTYVYAPKGDEWINLGWRFPLPGDELVALSEVVDTAAANRIRVCWELHILWGITFSGDEDLQIVADKFDAVAARGVDCFVLAFDDTDKSLSTADREVYAGCAEGQVDFANRLSARLQDKHPGAMLGFVPIEYWTNHPDFATDAAYLGEHLDPAWQLGWTGPDVVSATITSADAAQAGTTLGRFPLLGDNYPVSDAAQESGKIHLGPLVGREDDLAPLLSAVVFNPMPLAFASLPGLATAADWAWNPHAYDPWDSLHRTALLYARGDAVAALETLCRANRSPQLEGSAAPELETAIVAFWDAWDVAAAAGTGDAEALAALAAAADVLSLDHFSTWSDLTARLQAPALHPDMAAELAPWAERLEDYGKAGPQALDMLLATAAGDPPDQQKVDALAALASSLAGGPKPTGEVMDTFLARAVETLQE